MLGVFYNKMREAVPWELRVWFKKQGWFTPVTKVLLGSDVYCESYFSMIERNEKASVAAISAWIVENFQPRRIVDVGCGPGHMMAALRDLGVSTFGVDIAKAGLKMAKTKNLDVRKLDLTKNEALPGVPYDVVICCEVAEHLDAEFAPGLVKTLTGAGNVVFLTAAEPDSSIGPGLHHVNEQPNSYWISLMHREGWELDQEKTDGARLRFKAQNVISYLQKAMIFRPIASWK